MKKPRLWYPHYVRDFRAKTSHLSLAEKGAYRALMDEYWERQGPLPADDELLRRIIGATPKEYRRIRGNVLPYFEVLGDTLMHKRIEEEIFKAKATTEAKSLRLAEARKKRWAKTPSKEQQITDQITDQIIEQKSEQITSLPLPSPSPSHKKEKAEGGIFKGAPEARKKPTRLPPDWLIPPDWIGDAMGLGFSEREAKDEADRFRDYWIARADKGAIKVDWRATWRNWCRSANERRPRASHANGGAGGGYRKPVDPVEIRNRLQREIDEGLALSGDGRELSDPGVD